MSNTRTQFTESQSHIYSQLNITPSLTSDEELLAKFVKFIETPFQNLTDSECNQGVEIVLSIVSKNPFAVATAIKNIVKNDKYAEASYLLDDLFAKIRAQNCLDVFNSHIAKSLPNLMALCLFNLYDLHQLLTNMPKNTATIFSNLYASPTLRERVFNAYGNTSIILPKLLKEFPEHSELLNSNYLYNNQTNTHTQKCIL